MKTLALKQEDIHFPLRLEGFQVRVQAGRNWMQLCKEKLQRFHTSRLTLLSEISEVRCWEEWDELGCKLEESKVQDVQCRQPGTPGFLQHSICCLLPSLCFKIRCSYFHLRKLSSSRFFSLCCRFCPVLQMQQLLKLIDRINWSCFCSSPLFLQAPYFLIP